MYRFFFSFVLLFALLQAVKGGAIEEISIKVEAASQEKGWIETVLEEYEKGHYQSFLKKIDSQYRKIEKEWGYRALLAERKELSFLAIIPIKGKERIEKGVPRFDKGIDAHLLEICHAYPEHPLSERVKEMASLSFSPEEREAAAFLDKIASLYRGQGDNPLENQLIWLDIEFWLKSFSLRSSLSQGEISFPEYQKRAFVLEREKLLLMKAACMLSEEGKIYVVHLERGLYFHPKVARSSDTVRTLIALGKGRRIPQDKIEEAFQRVVTGFLKEQERSTLLESLS